MSPKQFSKIALVQAAPVIFDTPKTIEKVEKLVAEAAANGADLVLFPGNASFPRKQFPEAFVGGYLDGMLIGADIYSFRRTQEDLEEVAR